MMFEIVMKGEPDRNMFSLDMNLSDEISIRKLMINKR